MKNQKIFLTENSLLVVDVDGNGVFTSNAGHALRVADPKEVRFLSNTLPQIELRSDGFEVTGVSRLPWHYIATLPSENSEPDTIVFARKWGSRMQFICVDINQTGNNNRDVAHLKLYGVEGEYEVFVWTGPGRFTDYVDGDLVAVEEVSRPLGFGVNLDWFGLFGHETKLEAFKSLKKILGRSPQLSEVLSRPMNSRRRK